VHRWKHVRPLFTPLAAALALAACGQGEAAERGARSTNRDAPALETTVAGWRLEPAARVGGADAGEESQLYNVVAVTEDPEGRFYATNFGDKRVLVFDSTGAFVHAIGRGGQGPGEFTAPRSAAAVGSDALYVLDMIPGRLSRFRRSDGAFVSDVPLPADAGLPLQMQATPGGVLAIEFRPRPSDGKQAPAYIARVDTATGAVDRAGAVMLDTVARVQVGSSTEKGRRVVTVDLPFAPKPAWTLDREGAVLFGTGAEFVVRRSAGGEVSEALRGTGEPQPVTAGDRDEFFSEPGAEAFKDSEIPFPRTKPFFTGVLSGPGGTLWVRVPARGGADRWEVWSGGKKTGEVTLPAGSGLMHVSATSLYVIQTDEDDVESLVRYRLVRQDGGS
jgi:6-bladed beta-propeller